MLVVLSGFLSVVIRSAGAFEVGIVTVVVMSWQGAGAFTQSPVSVTLSLCTSHSVSTLVIIPSPQPSSM